MSNVCQYCNQTFVRRYGLTRHINEKRCKCLKVCETVETNKQIEALEKRIETLKEQTTKEIADLKQKPNNVGQVLQVICISSQDNYLDMLTSRLGDIDQAIEYIKDCALSNVTGDCKLIERIYFTSVGDHIHYVDKAKSHISYYNENREQVVDNKESFGRKIANNLQNSYLKGINYLINKNLEKRVSPNRFLEEYDLQAWNAHIYNLSDSCYQKKIVNQLNIPNAKSKN
jgi:hypothetical protein